MKYIAISFTLKDQPFDSIKFVLEELSRQTGGKSGHTVLVHGFMTRQAVIEKGFSTEVVDALSELFPYQLNCFVNGVPDRKRMAVIIKESRGTVYTIGEVKEGVKEEVDLYEANGINVSGLPLNWNGNMIARQLTYGETRVGLTFNHGEGPIFEQVNTAKTTCAIAIDQMNVLREASDSGEYKALATIAIRKIQSAQMDMVKAITWKD